MNASDFQTLYDRLPIVACRGFCSGECCSIAAPVGITELEYMKAQGVEFKASSDVDRACPFLTEGRCSIYSKRPFVCRIYGAEPVLPAIRDKPWRCGHGCEIVKEISSDQFRELLLTYPAVVDDPMRSTDLALNKVLEESNAQIWIQDGDEIFMLDRKEARKLQRERIRRMEKDHV